MWKVYFYTCALYKEKLHGFRKHKAKTINICHIYVRKRVIRSGSIKFPVLQTVLTPMADLVQTSMKALLSEISCVPLPLCDQRGGSSCPWGSRPFSRQERNASRCPPLGKWMGGLCTPSCPTNTMVPPQSAVRQGGHLKSFQ